MIKRFIVAIIALGLVFGGLAYFNWFRDQAINDHQHFAGPSEIERRWQHIQLDGPAIREQADEPHGPEVLDYAVMALAGRGGERKGDLDPPPSLSEDFVGSRLRCLAADRRSADPAERPADPGPEQAEVIVDLGRSPHR